MLTSCQTGVMPVTEWRWWLAYILAFLLGLIGWPVLSEVLGDE